MRTRPTARARDLRRWSAAARMLPRALGAAAVSEVGLRLLTLATTARLLGVGCDFDSSLPPAPTTILDDEASLASAVTRRVLRRWPTGDTCLRRALTAGHLLRHRSPVLRLGGHARTGTLQAHAWIELADGQNLWVDPTVAVLSRHR